MNNMKNLEDKISLKESQLVREKSESDVWNSGKYKNADKAIFSKSLVSSLEKELKELNKQLNEIKSKDT